jgi:hypothetical protein
MALTLTVTADELDALARRLGATRFPGVAGSIFDTVGPEHHSPLTGSLLAGLTARGLIAEYDGRLVATREVATLLAPTLHGRVWYLVERTEPGSRVRTAVGEVDGIVVLHRADGPYHRFDLVGTDGDVPRVLSALADPSPGPPVTTHPLLCRLGPTPSPRRSRANQGDMEIEPPLFALDRRGEGAELAALADGWLATTTVGQAGTPGGAPAMSWLSIMDSGAGRVWSVEPDPGPGDDGLLDGDDPLYRLTPIDPGSLHQRLTTWCGTAG